LKGGAISETKKMNNLYIPAELLFMIQGHLFDPEKKIPPWLSSNWYEMVEAQQSWRSFLNLRNNNSWKIMRRSASCYALNKAYSQRYLSEEAFRNMLKERMNDPYHQLSLNLSCMGFTEFTEDQGKILSGIFSINLAYNRELTRLPKIEHVSRLYLWGCTKLQDISLLHDIHYQLQLNSCQELNAVTRLESLKGLQMSHVNTSLLQVLSFHNLTKLKMDFPFSIANGSFDINCLVHLEEFSLFNTGDYCILPALRLPLLSKLEVHQLELEDISSLINLKKLVLESIKIGIIKGKEVIFKQLREFTGNLNTLTSADLDCFQNKLQSFSNDRTAEAMEDAYPLIDRLNFADVSLSGMINCFFIGSKVKRLNLSQTGVSSLTLDAANQDLPRRFLFVDLSMTKISDVSIFSNTRKIYLNCCYGLKDISPLRSVEYIGLMKCPNVEDFSCLSGNQKYLDISYNTNVQNKDLEKFSHVQFLDISYCTRVTDVSSLTNNLYITATNCPGLMTVELFGKDYLMVSVEGCKNLKKIKIHGFVSDLRTPCTLK
jgi:hypothetical protein